MLQQTRISILEYQSILATRKCHLGTITQQQNNHMMIPTRECDTNMTTRECHTGKSTRKSHTIITTLESHTIMATWELHFYAQ